jgi:hypothetical protein
VIRIVGDNHKNHVALFKHFGNGTLQNFIRHPYNIGLKLFFSFDYCHAVKNARNLFLDHDMAKKRSPLLELIYYQDRGRLNYPSDQFVGLIQFIISVIVEILPSIPKENINFVLKNILASYLSGNPQIQCSVHGKILCETLIEKLVPPVIVNFCNLHSQKNRKKK